MTDGGFEPVDVAVVGAGIVGSASAWNLALRGAKVAVFDRGAIGSEQSSRAWGFVRQQGRHEAEVPLAAEANRLWIELTRRFGPTSTYFTIGGILVPAETEADEERVVTGHAVASKFQLATRILNPKEIRNLVPQLRLEWRCGLYTASDAHAEPAASTQTIATAARASGVKFYQNTPVTEIELASGRVAGVVTPLGSCKASIVLLANGIGAPALARTVGLNLPIQTIRTSVGQTVRAETFTDVAMWGPRVAYRPRADGSFVLGNGYRGVGADYDVTFNSVRNLRYFLPAYRRNWRLLRPSFGREFVAQLQAATSRQGGARALPEPRPNERKVRQNLHAFRSMFPHLERIGLERTWAGRIDLTPDLIPIIDRPDPGRLIFVAAGFSGHGFALGPSVGKQLTEWIMDDRSSLDLKAFRLSRFADGDAEIANQAL